MRDSLAVLRDGRCVTLRSLKMSDAPELTKFASAIVAERRTNPGLGVVSFERRVTRREELEFLRKVVVGVRSQNVVDVAALDGNKVVGNCDVTRRKPRDISHSGLLGVVILDGYRGVGLGEAMIRRALEESMRVGIWLVELTVFATNSRALGLYSRLGFKKSGLVPDKIQRGGKSVDEVCMYIDLRDTDKSLPRGRGDA